MTRTTRRRAAWVWLALGVALSACGDDGGGDTNSNGAGTSGEATGTIYVSASASAGGDGSQGAPYRTLEEALAHDGSFDTVQLLEGVYTLPPAHQVTRDLALSGAGQEAVFVMGLGIWTVDAALSIQGATLFARLTVSGSGSASLQDLAVSGPSGALSVTGLASLTATAVSFSDTGGVSLAQVPQVTLDQVSLRGVSDGLAVTSVGDLQATGLTLERVQGHALTLVDTTATLSDLTIADVSPNPADEEGDGGDGLNVRGGALTLTGGSITNVDDRGAFFQEVTASLTDLTLSGARRRVLLALQVGAVVTATRLDAGDGPSAVLATDGARLTMTDSALHDAPLGCLLSSGGAQLDVSNSTFRDCASGHVSILGETTGGTFTGNTLERASDACVLISGTQAPVVFEGNTITGCVAGGISTLGAFDVTLTGNVIDTVALDPVFTDVGDGLSVVDSSIDARMNTIRNTEGKGIGLLRSSGRIELNEVSDTGDTGVSLVDPPQFEELQARTIIKDNTISAPVVGGVVVFSTTADVEGNTIRDVAFDASVGLGDGVVFAIGADVNALDNVIEDCAGNGISFDSSSGRVERNTLRRNTRFGVVDFCAGDSEVTVGDNTYEDNRLGDASLCE